MLQRFGINIGVTYFGPELRFMFIICSWTGCNNKLMSGCDLVMFSGQINQLIERPTRTENVVTRHIIPVSLLLGCHPGNRNDIFKSRSRDHDLF